MFALGSLSLTLSILFVLYRTGVRVGIRVRVGVRVRQQLELGLVLLSGSNVSKFYRAACPLRATVNFKA